MDRLTFERCNGIKTGYWSPAKKEDLVQRLGAYEDTGLDPEDFRLADRWSPVDEILPKDEEKVLVCTQTKDGRKNIVVGYYSPELGRWVSGMNSNVIAWMPLPRPYGEADS